MATPSTPSPAASEPGPDGEPARLKSASAWNLLLNLVSKFQTFAVLAAGSIIGGLSGVGVLATAAAATVLGQSLASFGLGAELARLNVAYPSRPTVTRSMRAIARQAPLGVVVAPLAYILVGPTSGSVALLLAVGLTTFFLVASVTLTAVLNGLGDFRTPAIRVGGARLVASGAAIAVAAVKPDPAPVLGCFGAAEAFGVVTLGLAVHKARSRLPDVDHPQARLHKRRHWFGIAAVVSLVTNQADTLLVSAILSPQNLGLFATASTLENGVATFATAVTTPTAYRAIRTTLAGDLEHGNQQIKRALMVAVSSAVVLGALGWIVAQAVGNSIGSFSGLSHGDGPLVVGLCLLAGPPGSVVTAYLLFGAGFGRHRPVGIRQIQVGACAVTAIVTGAVLAGPVGAAAGTIVRDLVGTLLTRGLARPPSQAERSAAAAEAMKGIPVAEPGS